MTDKEKKLQQEIGQQILFVKIIQEQNRSITGFYGVSKDSLCKWSGYTKAEIDNLISFTGVFDLHTFLLRFLREFPLAKIFESRGGCQYLACFLRYYGKGSYDREFWKSWLSRDGLQIHNDWFRSAYPQCGIPEGVSVEVLTSVLDFEMDYLFSATLEARKYFKMDVIKQMLAGMESIADCVDCENWFSVYQEAFELYALKKFSDGDWVKAANEENEKEKERILKWLQDHPKFVELLEKRELALQKEAACDGVDVDFVRELVKDDGLEPDFTPGELLEVWRKQL